MIFSILKENNDFLTIDDLRKILHYRNSNFSNSILAIPGDPHHTFCTFSIDCKKRQIILDIHLTKEYFIIDFDSTNILYYHINN